MTQFLDVFGFLSVLLRGFALAFEALTVGGVVFQLAIAREHPVAHIRRWLTLAAALLAATQVCVAATTALILIGSTDLSAREIVGADFFTASVLVTAGALAVALVARSGRPALAAALGCISILVGSTMLSHSAARLESRWLLMTLTMVHHAAGDAWIGGLPYLLLFLRHNEGPASLLVTGRFSALALSSVAALAGAGATMAWHYVGSPAALAGTTYGIMLAAKILLTGLLLIFGVLNRNIVRAVRRGAGPGLLPLARFAEAEIGIGFTVLLAAASLTSTPPAVDVEVDRVTAAEIAERMSPRWPTMETPALSELPSSRPLPPAVVSKLPTSFVPGQLLQPDTPADKAWSEYNHHWSGLIVVIIGLLAVLSRRFHWARHWPLAFFGLAIFLFVRSDPENWPLGPRGFWESFLAADVVQHRIFVLLVVAFAIFEWSVQTHRIAPARAGLVFPLVCAVGGALLLTHSHALGNVKEEFLAELSHIPLALLAVVAGWARWLEIRPPGERAPLTAWIWPVCFVLIGAVLMLYRES